METIIKNNRKIENILEKINTAKKEIHKKIVGLDRIIDFLFYALFTEGHILIIGVPGLAKSLLAETFAHVLDLDFKRIQFTPDLIPSDIIGTEIIDIDPTTNQKIFKFQKGPIFTNILLADEINRTPPKTQSALLEAMQEKQINVGNFLYKLDLPFMVIATQNPLEQEGTYPLPEAQLDRFAFSLELSYPNFEEEKEILINTFKREKIVIEKILNKNDIFEIINFVDNVVISEKLIEYIIKIVQETRKELSKIDEVKKYVEWGVGPRGTETILKGAKIKALLDGKFMVEKSDIDNILYEVLNHRIILNFQAKMDNINTKYIIEKILEKVKI